MDSIARHAVFLGLLAWGPLAIAEANGDPGLRHRGAVARVSVGGAPERGGDGVTFAESFRCPLDGEYVVAVWYDRDLAAIDAGFPTLERTFAGLVTVALNVGIRVRVVDEKTGEALEATGAPAAVFDVSTKEHRWSGERLLAYRLEADTAYRLEVDLESVDDDWLSLDPTFVVDPSAELQKSLAWRTRYGGR